MRKLIYLFIVGLGFALLVSPRARAHCDTLEGPVVSAARVALTTGDVTPVLMWVKAGNESEVRTAFDRTQAVRKQSKEAAELADMWFFETLVRIHRAGEGAPYTGLKSEPAAEPGVAAADRALDSGNVEEVLAETTLPLQAALKAKFERVRMLQPHAAHTVPAGREYVEAYVDYVHFAERLASLAPQSRAEHSGHAH